MKRAFRWLGRLILSFVLCLPSLGIARLAAEDAVPTEEQYDRIQTAFLRERFDQVAALAPPVLAEAFLEPKTVRIWLWLVLSLDRLHRAGEAMSEMDRLKIALADVPSDKATQVETDRFWPEALFWDGEISRKALKMVRARLAYRRLLKEFPASVWQLQAQLGLGLVLLHEQAYEEAQQQFQRVVLASSDSALAREAMLLGGLCDLQMKRFAEAAGRFRQLIEPPADPALQSRASFYLGEALTGLRQFEDAIHAYQRTITLDADSRWTRKAYFGLGWGEFQRHRCRESLEAFDRYAAALREVQLDDGAHETDDVSTDMRFAQGRCLMELGKLDEALAQFEAIRRDDPHHRLVVEAELSEAELLERARRFTEALAVLGTVSSKPLDPTQRAQVHLRSGSIYLAQGDGRQAVGAFQLAGETEDHELRQSALNGLGDASVLLGEHEQAVRWYEEAAQADPLKPGALYAHYQLGRLKLQTGKTEEAIALFQSVAPWAEGSSDPAGPLLDGAQTRQAQTRAMAVDIRLTLALAYLSNAQPALARAELERVRTQDLTSAQAARTGYYLTLLAFQDGDISQATRLCEDVAARAPESDEALQARVLLADLLASRLSPQEALVTLTKMFGSLQGLPAHHRGKLAKKLGDLARRSLSYAQAIRWYEAAWEDLPEQRGELDYRIASCYEEAGDVAMATSRYQAIAQAPWKIRGQLAAAKLMEREERWQEARWIYQDLAQQSAPEAKIAQERLLSMGRTRP